MTFPLYDEYKDSGVEWLGEVPAHWDAPPLYLRYSADLGKMLDSTKVTGEQLLPYLRNVDVQWDKINFEDLPTMDISPGEYERYTVKQGDLLVCEGGEVGRSAIVPLISNLIGYQKALHRLRAISDTEDPRFMFYIMNWSAVGGVFNQSGQATIAHLTGERLSKYRFPKPPLPEQTAVAAFLDIETAKIDELVAEQQNLIALLKEKRQALISHAVTKGLDPDVAMKDSGVEWLGEVPAHWSAYRLAALFEQVAESGNEALPVLSVSIHSGVSDAEIPEHEMDRMVVRSEDRTKYKRVQPGDLVYNMMRAWQGGFGTVTVQGMVSPAYVVARPFQTVLTAFVEMQLRSPTAVEEMRRHSRGVTDFRLRLYWEEFKTLQIGLPPHHEQVAISDYIDRETVKIDELIDQAESTINLLQERRTALISAAVTGKIDVRNCGSRKEVAAA